jgi:Cu+-exporting ATPase
MATDPVCGMEVDPAKAQASSDYEGQTYFFCSSGCLSKFRQNPASYVTRQKKSDDKAVTYTCPMHPEIRQAGPGACPKCGMALERIDA